MRKHVLPSFAVASLTAVFATPVHAGSDANYVLHNHHVEEQGVVDVSLSSDYGRFGRGEPNYTAQLLEIEYGVTDLLTTAVYLETAKTFADGENYDFASFRFESAFRLFREDTLLNPLLYAEYVYKRPNSRYIKDVVGRVDGEDDEEEEGSEHELETKLILGHDFTPDFHVAFTSIHEVNLETGDWAFGYAAGFNSTFFHAHDSANGAGEHASLDIEKLTLGVEMFGGVGDSTKGLTLDGSKTEHYIGINLRADLNNEVNVGIGVAVGLTSNSEDAILRTSIGYEFE